ncbi:MAG: ABC transporter permease [Leptospirales bacterium]|nr:ABC transporter permease [Leptospirales bacterium]
MVSFKSFVRIAAIADKEWLQIRRDARSLILSLLLPVFLILLFGFALSVDVKNVKLAIFDQDKSTTSRRFIEEFAHTEYLNILYYVENYRDIDRAIYKGEASLALVIPRNFENLIKNGKRVDVQLIVDGSDSTSAVVAIGYIKAIIANYNMDMKIKELKRAGLSSFELPLDIRSRILYNPELLSKNFIIPGLIVLILAIISALIASLTISKEWERGTMETLMTTPIRSWELTAGKLIPYLFIGLFDVVVTASVGHFVFDVPIKGNFIEFYLLALLFLFGTTGQGLLISAATKSQVVSVQFAMVTTFLPTFILSGFIFPIQNMPIVIQGITHIIPARYLIVIIKGIAIKGIGLTILWTQIIFLFVFAAIVLLICTKKLKMQLDN